VLPLEQVRKVASQSPPHTTEYCLARAVECDLKAEQCVHPDSKAIFLDLAKRWRDLARDSHDGTSLNPVGQSGVRPSTGSTPVPGAVGQEIRRETR